MFNYVKYWQEVIMHTEAKENIRDILLQDKAFCNSIGIEPQLDEEEGESPGEGIGGPGAADTPAAANTPTTGTANTTRDAEELPPMPVQVRKWYRAGVRSALCYALLNLFTLQTKDAMCSMRGGFKTRVSKQFYNILDNVGNASGEEATLKRTANWKKVLSNCCVEAFLIVIASITVTMKQSMMLFVRPLERVCHQLWQARQTSTLLVLLYVIYRQ